MKPAVSGARGTFGSAQRASGECLRHYQDEGWVLLRGFFDVERDIVPIYQHVNHLIDLKLGSLGLEPQETQRTIHSVDFLRLCSANRRHGGEIYRACRHLSPLHELGARSDLIALAGRFMATQFVNFIPYTALRIDIKGEEQYLFPWHQDYPYTQGSVDGIVVWVPLFDVGSGDGGIELIPGSHKLGLQRVELVDPENTRRNGAHSVRLHDMERFDALPSVTTDYLAGDALVFHTLLVHRSIPMTAGNVRWTTQIRYGNFSNPDAVRRGWPSGMIEGVGFQVDHPEFVVAPSGSSAGDHGR